MYPEAGGKHKRPHLHAVYGDDECELSMGRMLMNRVKEVSPLPNYRLDVVFRDGKRGVFDCNPYRSYPCLSRIWDMDVFTKVVADHGTVMWPDGSDLCPDEVYDKVEVVMEVAK